MMVVVALISFWSEMECKENECLEVLMIMEEFLGILALLGQCYLVQDLVRVQQTSIIINVQMKTRKVSLSSIKSNQINIVNANQSIFLTFP
jgi:hypothetical protein